MSHVLEPLTISQVARVFSVSLILLSLRTPSWLLSLVHKYSLFFFFFFYVFSAIKFISCILNFPNCPFCPRISLCFLFNIDFTSLVKFFILSSTFLNLFINTIFKSLSYNSEADRLTYLLLTLWISILDSSSGWFHPAPSSGSLVVTGWSQLASGVWSCQAVRQGASALLHVAFPAARLRHVHMATVFHNGGNSRVEGGGPAGGNCKGLAPISDCPQSASGHNFTHFHQSKIHAPPKRPQSLMQLEMVPCPTPSILQLAFFFPFVILCPKPGPSTISGLMRVPHFGI